MKNFTFGILTILVMSCLSTDAYSQWVAKQSFGGSVRTFAMGFSINDTAYVFGGSDVNGTTFRDNWAYDPVSDSWTQKANIPGGFRCAAVTFSIGNKAYFGTGNNGVDYLDDFYEYDATTNTWLTKTNFPGGPREEAVGFSIGNKGYIGTGQIFIVGPNNSFTQTYNDFYEYDPVTDAWTQKASIPGLERAYAVGTGFGNKGYVGLGGNDDQSGSFTDFYEYDPITDSWTSKTSMPGIGMAESGILSTSSALYIFGGINFPNFTGTSSCRKYDPNTNTWTSIPLFGGGVIIAPVVVNVNGKGYVGTGYTNTLALRNDWWEFTPSGTTDILTIESESLNLFPNPTSGSFTIDCSDCRGLKTSVDVFDQTGKLVLQKVVSPFDIIQLNASALSPGLYTVKVRTENRPVRQIKFIR